MDPSVLRKGSAVSNIRDAIERADASAALAVRTVVRTRSALARGLDGGYGASVLVRCLASE